MTWSVTALGCQRGHIFLSCRFDSTILLWCWFFFLPKDNKESSLSVGYQNDWIEMNIFRLLGDLSHLVAIVLLLLKIWKSRSCAGTPSMISCQMSSVSLSVSFQCHVQASLANRNSYSPSYSPLDTWICSPTLSRFTTLSWRYLYNPHGSNIR